MGIFLVFDGMIRFCWELLSTAFLGRQAHILELRLGKAVVINIFLLFDRTIFISAACLVQFAQRKPSKMVHHCWAEVQAV